MGILSDTRIRALHAAVLSIGLDRTALLAGIAPTFTELIPTMPSPSEQTLVDLFSANGVDILENGQVPLLMLLGNAASLSELRKEQEVFQAVISEVHAALSTARSIRPPKPSYRDAVTKALGEELAAERVRKTALEAAGAPADASAHRILELRRKLREGGQLREGDTLKQYTLLEKIGRGGFAVVWRAFAADLRSVVAVKVLHPNLAEDQVRRERFFRGARVMASLDHPAIVKVLSPAEEDEGFHFFVMEFVDGQDLHHAVVHGHVPRYRVLEIILTIGDALALAHARRYVHRDIKPLNILVSSRGEPKLTDFDLVGAGDTTGGTRTGALGSFLYAAPELLSKPQDADARADVFGLAMTAVFAFHGAPLPQTVLRHTDAFVDTLACSAVAKAVLKRALDWEPAHRFPDASAFCGALRAHMALGGRMNPRAESPPLPAFEVEEENPIVEVEEEDLIIEVQANERVASVQPLDEVALEEAEFFASQGMFDDARAILDEQLARIPNHPLVLERKREVEAMAAAESAARVAPHRVLPAQPQEDRAFDIAAALDSLDHLDSDADLMGQHQISVESALEQFKDGVAAQVSPSDWAVHYDLAVAYKEMGLFTDAISEFEDASREPSLECVCQFMIGMLHIRLGNLGAGIDALMRGLRAAQKTREQDLAIMYEVANAHELARNTELALFYFQRLQRAEPKYHDPRGAVADRVHKLSATEDFDAAFDKLLNGKPS